MGFTLGGWQQVGGGSVLAGLVGQDIVAKTLTLSGASTALFMQQGNISFANDRGINWAGTTDFLSGDTTGLYITNGNGQRGIRPASNRGGGLGTSLSAWGSSFFDVASGSNSITIITAGARLKLSSGGTTDYLSSDGSTLITAAGAFAVADKLSLTSYTDDSANAGNRTVNNVRGKSAIAAAAATCVITNSFITVNSQIIVTLEFVDATATFVKACIPAAGSFTLTANAAATANTKFSWIVIN